MNESAVGFCCNTVNIFPVIISNNVTEVGRGLEKKIIQKNLSQKKCVDKKKTNERNIHDRLYLNTETTRKKLRFKIMLTRSTTEQRGGFSLQGRKD